ncbi:MAG: hypothetical protein Unbinned400contig1002_25 [Prokaryotic dsDNA virus sp.]|nr:MAG: hypothetical protein Unbinned400contig1002_25 [Prokaryotic dsDNA virus sp.]|tara:strand:+ start:9222 stop:9494 length:273 start_codon:yes stop_codon:yes gene_type:complete
MTVAISDSVTLSESVTAIVVKAGEAAGESALDSVYPWLEQHWWLPTLLVVLRIAQPVLWNLSQKTKTNVDDNIVKVLSWLVGAVERRKKK